MIIPNGLVSFKLKEAAQTDPETGYPRKAEASWGQPIPCQWKASHYDLRASSSGVATVQQSYEILIDLQQVPSERILLEDLQGRRLGEFSLRQWEDLGAVCQTRLVV